MKLSFWSITWRVFDETVTKVVSISFPQISPWFLMLIFFLNASLTPFWAEQFANWVSIIPLFRFPSPLISFFVHFFSDTKLHDDRTPIGSLLQEGKGFSFFRGNNAENVIKYNDRPCSLTDKNDTQQSHKFRKKRRNEVRGRGERKRAVLLLKIITNLKNELIRRRRGCPLFLV